MKIEELEARWNARADRYNQWSELGIDEIVEFAQQECLKTAQKPPGLYVGTVKYVRAGGNAGLSWYVAPDFESVEYGYQPNEGDLLYAVPNEPVQGPPSGGPAGTQV